MTDLNSILTNKYPVTKERIEGRLQYLEKYGVTKLSQPLLTQKTGLDFFKAKFFTGYRKFGIIDVVIGLKERHHQLFLLTNPLFSEEYSNLTKEFEKILADNVDNILLSEIIELYKETGSIITKIEQNKYQIWFGEHKWRIQKFKISETLEIGTTPNIEFGEMPASE